MSTKYQIQSAAAQVQVISTGYYTGSYMACLKKLNMTQVDVEKMNYPNRKLNALWEEFWWQLPDSMGIRHEPFFMICNLCEDVDLVEDTTQV